MTKLKIPMTKNDQVCRFCMRKRTYLTCDERIWSYIEEILSELLTGLQRLYGHLLVLGGPQSLPHLSEVSLSQLLDESELLSRPLPRLHVKQLPLHTDDRERFKTISSPWTDDPAQTQTMEKSHYHIHQHRGTGHLKCSPTPHLLYTLPKVISIMKDWSRTQC